MNKKVLITGAAGNIGSKLVHGLRHNYDLILLDRKSVDNEDLISADLSDYHEHWAHSFRDMSAVLHLAANPNTDATWEELVPDNIDSVLNICEACAQAKIERLIFASSCQIMKGYQNGQVPEITPGMAPLPENHYGASKLIGERVCKSYSEKYAFPVICLRIGWVPREGTNLDAVENPWLRSVWLSTTDLIQIFEKAIEAPVTGFRILYAVSQNKDMKWDLSTTSAVLGYVPSDGLD